MPRTKKKRGKFDVLREQRKEKRGEGARENVTKRRKLDDGSAAEILEAPTAEDAYFFEDTTPGLGAIDEAQPAQDEMVYYGLLDEDEQTYYTNVNNKIVANDFEDEEERLAFIEAVYRESRGKEMKLASSQSCSRHLERIIRVSNAEQLRDFFAAIIDGITQLIQHRFGSHVCETLFSECAKHVLPKEQEQGEEGKPSITDLFLKTTEQLQENIGYMLTDKFASHTVRVLLLVLSGEPLDNASTKNLLASKKKESIEAPSKESMEQPTRKVPKSFPKAMSKLTGAAVASLDTTYLRALATHPTGNPVLQLLLRLELINSDRGRTLDDKSLFYRLFDPDNLSPDSEGVKFMSGLTYDSTGSRLVEVLVVHAPGKVFKKLYKGVWKDKMQSMAKNDIASFVAIKLLERLGKDELRDARDTVLSDLSLLLARKRFALLKTLIERSTVRELDPSPMVKAFDHVKSDRNLLQRLLYPPSEGAKAEGDAGTPNKADVHGSLLAQSMLEVQGLGQSLRDDLANLDAEELVKLSCDTVASRAVQSSMTSPSASLPFRKRIVPHFYGRLLPLATDSAGSYVVDALWQATNGLHFIKERLAGELASHESELRDSYPGRKVWRNWSMDLYSRRRGEWQALAKGMNVGAAENEVKKTPIELARLRRAEEKAKQQEAAKMMVSANA